MSGVGGLKVKPRHRETDIKQYRNLNVGEPV